MTEQISAGWYPEAGRPGKARWWDGQGWTENRLDMTSLETARSSPKSHEVIDAPAPSSSVGVPPGNVTTQATPVEESRAVVSQTDDGPMPTFGPIQFVGTLVELNSSGVLRYRKMATSKPHLEIPMTTIVAVKVSGGNNIIDFDRVGQPPLAEVSAASASALVRTSTITREEWARVRQALTAAERFAVAKTLAPPMARSKARKTSPSKPAKPGRVEGWISAVVGGLFSAGVGAFAGGLSHALISGVIGAVGFGVFSYLKAQKEAGVEGVGGTFRLGGASFAGGRIMYAGQSQSLVGTHTEVLTSGQISRRFDWGNTITGGVLFGPLGAVVGAGEKKKDDRELYLLISGPERVWSVKLNPKDSGLAHQFAAAANTAALQAAK